MEIINVIATHPECAVNEITSFAVMDDESRDEVNTQAEECFVDMAVKYQFGEDAEPSEEQDDFRDTCNESLDDGYIDAGGHTISIVHSYTDNVQL